MSDAIRVVDPTDPDIAAILTAHLELMRASSPACSIHALDLDAYEASGTTLYALFEADSAVAVGGLREYAPGAFEIKSMHVPKAHRGRGLAQRILTHLLDVARARGGTMASLETGSQPVFAPAHGLYLAAGFRECPPFGDYALDPNSRFFTRAL